MMSETKQNEYVGEKVKEQNFIVFNTGYKKKQDVDVGEAHCIGDIIKMAVQIDNSANNYAAMWYRGVPDADWGLLPKCICQFDVHGERTMFSGFKGGAHVRRENCPPDSDLGAWISVMQHHGLPTRLLDWTTSLLVAAYFVIWRDREDDGRLGNRPGAIWVTIPGILNENLTGSTNIYTLCDLHFSSLKTSDLRTNLICAASPVHRDIRMMVQSGVFTVHDNSSPLDEIPNGRKALRRIIIPSQSKLKLANELERCGINRSALFPDLENLAHHIRDSTYPAVSKTGLQDREALTRKQGKWFATDPPPFCYPGQGTIATGVPSTWTTDDSNKST